MLNQRTIAQDIKLSGIGLHTGVSVNLILKPAAVNAGMRFIRVDFPGRPSFKVEAANARHEAGMPRCSSIGPKESAIHTVEHLMAVLCGLGISNLIIELDGPEIPGLDGSGIEFLQAIKKAGIVDQDIPANFYKVQEPIGVEQNGSSIYIVPADDFKISYTLDYDHPYLKSQFFTTTVTEASFEKDIAPCRTFCLESEANDLRSHGLGLGANHQNTLVVGEKGVLNNTVRFSDEFARHKVLDFIGDLYLLGMPIKGYVYAIRSGHTLNIRLMNKILDQKERYERKGIIPGFDIQNKREISVEEIMKILPHRYPFLLVDRVIEIERGKKAIGIKNVTINDNFFQGHFPTRPVMPGVLMIEAMAQTGGVVVLTSEEHRGKVAFFMAVDNVKFRKVVVPGDQLIMEVEVVKDRGRIACLRAVAKVDGEVAAEADMVFSFTDASYLDV